MMLDDAEGESVGQTSALSQKLTHIGNVSTYSNRSIYNRRHSHQPYCILSKAFYFYYIYFELIAENMPQYVVLVHHSMLAVK